ncbi:MAG: nucleotidyltransferase domain-containing protein [Nanoarchaeota archaeon]
MSLINTLRKNPEVRTIFGKKEIEIIEKQILGIKLKPSEKTRLSRDIKKKLIAVKKLSESISEFDLKKGQDIKKKIGEAKEVIFENKYSSRISRIWVYGSTAANDRTFSSDIDIAVEFTNISKKEATEFRINVSGKLSDMVDIQVYNILPEKIRKEIDKNGKVIHERENRR